MNQNLAGSTVAGPGKASTPALNRKAVADLEPAVFIPFSPAACPELLTEEEAIRYLRLDTIEGLRNPKETLARYRAMGMLRGTQVSKRIFYRRVELERFLERLTDENPR